MSETGSEGPRVRATIARAAAARDRGETAVARGILESAIAETTAAGGDADELRAELAASLVDGADLDAARRCLAECRPAVRRSHAGALYAGAKLLLQDEGRSRESRAAFETALTAAEVAGDAVRAVSAAVMLAKDELQDGDAAGAVQRLRAALGAAAAPELRGARVLALLGLSEALWRQNLTDESMPYARQALALAGELGNSEHEASALRLIAFIHAQSGAGEQAVEAASQSVLAAERSGSPRTIALALHCLAQAHLVAGDLARAIAESERGVAFAREHGDPFLLCVTLGGLGAALFGRGDLDPARQCAAEALAIARSIRDRSSEMVAQSLIAGIAEKSGDPAAALAAERERARIDGQIRSAQSSQRLDRLRAELESERRQSAEARATEAALRDALAEVGKLQARLAAENQYLREEIVASGGFEDIVGRSPPLRRVLHEIAQVAPTDAPVLILGETGVGKELVARAIHSRSPRREAPLVTINCATLPQMLIESELFGHEKGAFTGASSRRIGRFELADGGTILLDEIGELPLDLQVKLLRVLQDGTFERLGESVTRRTDVRVIAATNRDLLAASRAGKFRSDLYYRLAVFRIDVPPLRERRDDIPLLVAHFASRFQTRLGKRIERIPEEVMREFTAYDWPGNVRELASVVQRAVILSPGDALVLDRAFGTLAPAVETATVPAVFEPMVVSQTGDSLAEVERSHVLRVLAACGWRIKGPGNAAARLGVPPSTLRSRMERLGITRAVRG